MAFNELLLTLEIGTTPGGVLHAIIFLVNFEIIVVVVAPIMGPIILTVITVIERVVLVVVAVVVVPNGEVTWSRQQLLSQLPRMIWTNLALLTSFAHDALGIHGGLGSQRCLEHGRESVVEHFGLTAGEVPGQQVDKSILELLEKLLDWGGIFGDLLPGALRQLFGCRLLDEEQLLTGLLPFLLQGLMLLRKLLQTCRKLSHLYLHCQCFINLRLQALIIVVDAILQGPSLFWQTLSDRAHTTSPYEGALGQTASASNRG